MINDWLLKTPGPCLLMMISGITLYPTYNGGYLNP